MEGGMRAYLVVFIASLALSSLLQAQAANSAASCIECHSKQTPNIVSDWKLSKHSQVEVTCIACHGDQHQSASDVAKVKIPTPETCAQCHQTQVDQYKHGKHSKAWPAMMAMPTIHWQPMAMIEGQKGCGACHKIGEKPVEEIAKLRRQGNEFGSASCDSCHTRHTFSVAEAKSPQACETCHMGFDHPQWEMYSSSKHGVREDLKQRGILKAEAAAPTCQTCHMQDGDHGVRTAWGFLAVRLPLPEDKQWAADRATILEALGVLDPDGKPTALVATVQAADLARLTQEAERARQDCQDLRPVPRRRLRQAATGSGRRYDQERRPSDGRGDQDRGRSLQGWGSAAAEELCLSVPESADVSRCTDGNRAETVRYVFGAPHADLPRHVPR
jgi:hypothetical protein